MEPEPPTVDEQTRTALVRAALTAYEDALLRGLCREGGLGGGVGGDAGRRPFPGDGPASRGARRLSDPFQGAPNGREIRGGGLRPRAGRADRKGPGKGRGMLPVRVCFSLLLVLIVGCTHWEPYPVPLTPMSSIPPSLRVWSSGRVTALVRPFAAVIRCNSDDRAGRATSARRGAHRRGHRRRRGRLDCPGPARWRLGVGGTRCPAGPRTQPARSGEERDPGLARRPAPDCILQRPPGLERRLRQGG